VSRFGALAHLDFDHLDLRIGSLCLELLRIEFSVCCPATEIAAAEFPDKIAATLPVVARHAAFARVMVEMPGLGALVQRQNGIAGQRAETHCRDVVERCGIGLLAVRPPDGHTQLFVVLVPWRDGVVHPTVVVVVDIKLRAERQDVLDILRAVIDHRAAFTRKGFSVLIAFKEILPDFRPDGFENIPEMSGHRVISKHSMFGLLKVVEAYQRQRCGNHEGPDEMHVHREHQDKGDECQGKANGKNIVAGRKHDG